MSMQALQTWSIIRDITALDQPSLSSLRHLFLLGNMLVFHEILIASTKFILHELLIYALNLQLPG
jgi:hypothetical protein